MIPAHNPNAQSIKLSDNALRLLTLLSEIGDLASDVYANMDSIAAKSQSGGIKQLASEIADHIERGEWQVKQERVDLP